MNSRNLPKPLTGSRFNGNPVLFLLIGLVIFSCTTLLLGNYFTIKTLSVTRSLIYGESNFSKSEKDAFKHLYKYLETHDEKYYMLFDAELELVKNDGLALNGIISNGSRAAVISNLMKTNIAEQDAADTYWLIKNFKNLEFLKNSISVWQAGNYDISLVQQLALKAQKAIREGRYTEQMRYTDEQALDLSGDKITKLEYKFSNILNDHSRMIRGYLQIGNFLLILAIISMISYFFAITIRRAYKAADIMKQQNNSLVATNDELDRFVYSASHDLRAPITSLKGLVSIIMEESDMAVIRHIANLMNQSLDLQDDFIKEIINYSRNKRSELNIEMVNISELIAGTISQHCHMEPASKVEILAESRIGEILSDSLRLKIIFNNLISNAIKFSDEKKSNQHIVIRSWIDNDKLMIEVEDNGVGIHADYQEKIFDMFFVTLHNKRGSGLGLYIIKETILKMGGMISVSSELGAGSCFKVMLPYLLAAPDVKSVNAILVNPGR